MKELKLACELAYAIGRAIKPHIGKMNARKVKRFGYGDETFAIDEVAEGVVERFCERRRIAYITEDVGFVDGESDFIFLVDPIDGTRNAMKGLPHYACAIAIANKINRPRMKDVFASLVCEFDRNRTFVASSVGSFLYLGMPSDKKVPIKRLSESPCDERIVIAPGSHFGESYVAHSLYIENLSRFFKVLPRIYNSSAIELCYVAEGAINVCMDMRPMLGMDICAGVHDVCASYFILKKADCPISMRAKMGSKYLKNGDIPLDPKVKVSFLAACNQLLFKKISDLIGWR